MEKDTLYTVKKAMYGAKKDAKDFIGTTSGKKAVAFLMLESIASMVADYAKKSGKTKLQIAAVAGTIGTAIAAVNNFSKVPDEIYTKTKLENDPKYQLEKYKRLKSDYEYDLENVNAAIEHYTSILAPDISDPDISSINTHPVVDKNMINELINQFGPSTKDNLQEYAEDCVE